ncbi:hypothetical protein [Streptomyces justiciae]|uniref:hypothetical protein n=1 Tax=Streptomyces justiciae TaxID=2780140 RepID=UPI0018824904|nr:hypothetical protein [Streptomyces justiciae]MBE8478473.1 hypothetical protein [Streptomyces justiciae]
MISEPEMKDGSGFGPRDSAEVVSDLVERSPCRPLRRRPWLWALGGAAAASALWAATLLLLPPANHSPDPHGYRLDQESCKSARLASLQEALAPNSVPGTIGDELLRHPALDQVHCSLAFQKRVADKATGQGGHWSVTATVDISVALHKRTDPRDEFDADRRVTGSGVVTADQVRPVPGLGDEAFLIAEDMGHTELRVLDGAAVVTLSLSTTSYYESDADNDSADSVGEGPDLPGVSTYWPAMISDMRELMSDLTKRA